VRSILERLFGWGELSRVLLVEFVVQLIDFQLSLVQSFFPHGGDLVDAPLPPTNVFKFRAQESAALQSVEQRVKCSGSDPVSVMLQLFDHGQSEDRFMGGMKQHLNPYEAEKEFSLVFFHQ
jgi:hypothetical protein